MRDRQDNALLSDIIADYSKNFIKFNIMEVEYIKTMNTVLEMDLPLPVDLTTTANRYLHFLKESRKKINQHEMQGYLLEGLDFCGKKMLQSAYMLGSMHEQVLDCIS